MLQKTALTILKSGHNVFLTGSPGTGKTYTLTQYIDLLRAHEIPIAVTASTGIAASHIGGTTLHAFAGLGIGEIVIDESFLKNISKNRRTISRILRTHVLIIDEISMVPPHVFAAVDQIMRHVRVSSKPFGGVQLIVSGDFYQLPPVQRGILTEDSLRYAWQSDTWAQSEFRVCYLHERHRHSDEAFVQILDEIRSGTVSEDSQELLIATRHAESLSGNSITRLYTHNTDVNLINDRELVKLKTEGRRYRAQATGREPVIQSILGATLIVETLTLKRDALVMFIRNDRDGRYVNGTLGRVSHFDAESGLPLIETLNGDHILVTPEEWLRENDAGTTTASIRQLPLRLAWALTVHKSQGMTLDAAEIDLSRSFEVGQGYVALSRVRTLSGLRLLGANEHALSVDCLVQGFDQEAQEYSEKDEEDAQNLTQDEHDQLWHDFIISSGGVLTPCLIESLHATETKPKKQKTPTHHKTRELLELGGTITEIAEKRSLKTGTICAHIEKLCDEDENFHITRTLSALPDDAIDAILEKAQSLYTDDDADHFSSDGTLRLRPLWEALDKKFTYDEVREALLFL